MNSTPTPEERSRAAMAWLIGGPLTSRLFLRGQIDSRFVAFQTRQARLFYTTVLITGLVAVLLTLLIFGGLMLISAFLMLLSTDTPDTSYLPAIAFGLFLASPLLYVITAMILALLIIGGGRIIGFVVALKVRQGHNVRLPIFARRAERSLEADG